MRSAGFTPRARKLSRSIQAWCSLVKQRASHCPMGTADRKSTRLNSSHSQNSYAVFCLKKKKPHIQRQWRRDITVEARHPVKNAVDIALLVHGRGRIKAMHRTGYRPLPSRDRLECQILT